MKRNYSFQAIDVDALLGRGAALFILCSVPADVPGINFHGSKRWIVTLPTSLWNYGKTTLCILLWFRILLDDAIRFGPILCELSVLNILNLGARVNQWHCLVKDQVAECEQLLCASASHVTWNWWSFKTIDGIHFYAQDPLCKRSVFAKTHVPTVAKSYQAIHRCTKSIKNP